LALIGFIGVCWLAGAVGRLSTPSDWYDGLHKPLITPPDWVFGVVWPILYSLLGAAGWLVWDSGRRLRGVHATWAVLVGLNAAWPWLFFGMRRMDLALIAIIAVLLALAVLMWQCWSIRPASSALLLPYLGWMLFATLLNIAMLGLN
jgi:tryptophan-rich sensory protein